MTPQVRGKGGHVSIYVPWSGGYAKQRSCGTRDRAVVRGMERLVRDLRDRRRWSLLDAVIDGRCTLGRLYDAHVANRLDALDLELSAIDLAPLVEEWIRHYLAQGGSERNAPIYRAHVRMFVGDSLRSHELTKARVMQGLADMTDVTSGTRRGRLMALRSFVRYLVAKGHLPVNPIRDIEAPKKNPPSMRYESQAVDEAIVAAAPSPSLASLWAFIHATGADLSPVIDHTERRDLDLDRGVARLRGTKHAKRQVHEAIIEPWALPILRDYLRGMMPHVKPWATVDRFASAVEHRRAAAAVGAPGYTLRMARHSVAVRARKAGRSFEWIAGQLGNSVYQVATVYGRYKLETEERLQEANATAVTTSRSAPGRTRHG